MGTTFATDPASAQAALSKIKPGTIPISAVGYSDTNEERDELYGRVFGD